MYYPPEYHQKLQYERESIDTTSQRKRNSKVIKNESMSSNQCKICGLVNFNAWSLTIHMRRHNNDRPAKCSYCPAAFVNNTELKSHLTTHTKEKKYKCRFCQEWFTNNSSKYVHEDKHGILEHKCKYCDETFRTQVERRTHQKSHGREALSCRYCVKKFVNEDFLKIHEDTEHEKSLKCLKCKLKFPSKEELAAHKKVHKSTRRVSVLKRSNEINYFQDSDVKLSSYFFTCGICLEKFSFQLELSKHIETEHPLEKDTIYKFKCTTCNKSFDSKMKLRGHLIGHGPKKHPCPYCDYRSTRGKDLEKHIFARHLSGKRFKCSECGAAFAHYSTFVCHKLKHGEKKFQCDMCDKAYYVKSRLSNHKRVSHYSENPVCDQCGKVFRNILTLRSHQKSFHNRPLSLCLCNLCGKSILINEISLHQKNCFKNNAEPPKMKGPLCSRCNITFSLQRDLVEHFKEYHPNNVYPCNVCHKVYLTPKLTEKHMEKYHTDKPVLRKRKNIFTIEEKRLMKSKNYYDNIYECFACGGSFSLEKDLDNHLDQTSCLQPRDPIDLKQASVPVESQQHNFTVTKVYESNGCAQILNDYEVQVLPISQTLEYVTLLTVSSPNEIENLLLEPKTKKKKKKIMESLSPLHTHSTLDMPQISGNENGGMELSNTEISEQSFRNELESDPSMYPPPPQNITSNLGNKDVQNSNSGVMSSKQLLKLLQEKTVMVDNRQFIPFNELFEHLKLVTGVELDGTN